MRRPAGVLARANVCPLHIVVKIPQSLPKGSARDNAVAAVAAGKFVSKERENYLNSGRRAVLRVAQRVSPSFHLLVEIVATAHAGRTTTQPGLFTPGLPIDAYGSMFIAIRPLETTGDYLTLLGTHPIFANARFRFEGYLQGHRLLHFFPYNLS